MAPLLVSGDVTLPAYGRAPATPAFAMVPAGATRGVVVIHEIFGRQPEIDRVVARLAGEGYAAIAPDLFARGKLTCLRETFEALRSGEGIPVEQARGARAWLAERGVDPAAVALLGFCFGGGFALAAGAGWGAVSSNYGLIPSESVLARSGPIVACYGGRDRVFAKAPGTLRRRAARAGVAPEIHLFPEVGHSFLTDGDHPIARAASLGLFGFTEDAAVREEGWRRILAFFERHLGSGEAASE